MRRALGTLSLVVGCAISGRSPPKSDGESALPRRWHYEVRVDEALSRLDATVCFEGIVPAELRPGRDAAAVHLDYARWLSPGAARKLAVVRGRIQLDASVRDACVAYGVRLEQNVGMDMIMRRSGRDLIASPNVWLWRPQRRLARASATLRLALPQGMRATLPWRQRDGAYELGAEAFRFDTHAAFGRFEPLRFTHRAIPVEVAILDGGLTLTRDGAQRWLERSLEIASTPLGRFPAESLQVLVLPSGPGGDPVRFGTVARGSAGSVLLFVSSDAQQAELETDWVLPHELSHLWLPFVEREQAWISEGFATYYQEVLRARGGAISVRQALTNLATELRSASREGTGRTLDQESRDMYETYAFRPVYWGGAAFFLIADVELRRRSHGHASLDSVLLALRNAGAHARTWTDRQLLARMDELAGQELFVPLAEQCLARPFPDFEPTLDALGVREEDGVLSLDDAALFSDIRRAIFEPR